MMIRSILRPCLQASLVVFPFLVAQTAANVAEFTPTGDAVWNDAGAWSTGSIPNASGTAVRIPAPAPDSNRTVSLNAPITVGSLHFNLLHSGSRTRLEDTGSGHRLTFEDPGGSATLRVTGTGSGFAETQFTAPIVLASDLEVRVDNIVGDLEHGALRLRTDWEGPGGLIKTGLGIATLTGDTKRFTGPLDILQGVLRITEPATPRNTSGVLVEPGGQLRLVSGSGGNDQRVYSFGGVITLNSEGRGSEIPDSNQEGVQGALRYDPGVNNNRAILTNDIVISGPSSIHVDGTRNQLELTGRLQGSAGFSKSGGGILILNNPHNPAYTHPIKISNSLIELVHGVGSDIVLDADGALSGWGTTGALSGEGSVWLDKSLLAAPGSDGLHFIFTIVQNGVPDFLQPAAAQNGVLLLDQAPTRINGIAIYLDGLEQSEPVDAYGGFMVPETVDLESALRAVQPRIYVPDINGSHSFANRNWNLTAEVSVRTAVIQTDVGDGPVAMKILRISQNPDQLNYSTWRNSQFSDPAERTDDSISGPMAIPRNDGVRNLERYAFGMPWDAHPADYWPRIVSENNEVRIQFVLRPNLADIRYQVLRSNNLENWDHVLYDSDQDGITGLDANSRKSVVDSQPPFNDPRFYRVVPELK